MMLRWPLLHGNGYCGEQGAVLSPMVATGTCNANPLPDREGVCATVDGHAERCGGTVDGGYSGLDQLNLIRS